MSAARKSAVLALLLLLLLGACVASTLSDLYDSIELQVFGPHSGYDEKELAGKIDAKKFFAVFEISKLPVEANISDFIIDASVSRVCLVEPYSLPDEFSLNGTPQPNDSIWYVTFLVADTPHFYAVPLESDYQIEAGCRSRHAVFGRSCMFISRNEQSEDVLCVEERR